MRRIFVVLIALVVGLSAVIFIAFNLKKLFAELESGKPRVVVVLRDIPEAYPLQSADVALRPMDPENIPAGALIETSDKQPAPVLGTVIGRASLKSLPKDSLIFADTLYPMDVVERLRATTVLVAKTDLPPGTPITAEVVTTNYKKNAEVPPASISGAVGEPAATILARVPALFAREPIAQGAVITYTVTTPQRPFDGSAVPTPADPYASMHGVPLDPEEIAPQMPPEVLASRLAATPEAVKFDHPEEYEAIAGRKVDYVDVYVGTVSDGLETHRRALTSLRLYRYAGNGSAGQDQRTYWILTEPDFARHLDVYRREGAMLMLVPTGGAVPARPAGSVLCHGRLCYRSAAARGTDVLPPDLAEPIETESVGRPNPAPVDQGP